MPRELTPTDAEQVGLIAARFRELQGLRLIPLGIYFLFFLALEIWLPFSRDGVRAAGANKLLWIVGIDVGAFAVALVAVRWVSGWYRRKYGWVEPTAHQRLIGMIIGGVGTAAFMIPFEIETIFLNGRALPFNPLDLGLALAIFGFWLYMGRSFRHYLALAGVGFVLSLASAVGITPATFAWHMQEATLYLAVATIVAGIIDHRILTSMLAQTGNRIGISS